MLVCACLTLTVIVFIICLIVHRGGHLIILFVVMYKFFVVLIFLYIYIYFNNWYRYVVCKVH